MAETLTKWEYLQWGGFVEDPAALVGAETTEYLQALGAAGWELVSTMVMPHVKTGRAIHLTDTVGWTVTYVFKRPVKI